MAAGDPARSDAERWAALRAALGRPESAAMGAAATRLSGRSPDRESESGKIPVPGKAAAGTPQVQRASLAGLAAAGTGRPRMVFGIDATASREHAWDTARTVTDSLFSAAPGGIEVALAAHGGNRLSLFTGFHTDVAPLRRAAAAITCEKGMTRLLDMAEATLQHPGVRALVYVGDCFEEDPLRAMVLADRMRLRGIRLVVLHDLSSAAREDAHFFAVMAARTGGLVLPFDAASLDALRDVLASLAAYVAGGTALLRARSTASPASKLLLAHFG